MFLTKTVRLLAVSALIASPMLSIQTLPAYAASATVAQAPASLAGSIRNLESGLSAVEKGTAALGASGRLSAADLGATFDDAYASGMNSGMSSALSAAQSAAQSKGASGEVASLKAFEDLAKRHEARLRGLASNADSLVERIRSGAVMIDPAAVASRSRAEKEAFKAFLSPSARLKYAALASIEPAAPTFDLAASPDAAAAACSLAAPCVLPCWTQNWGACLSCLANAIPAARAAWQVYQKCKGGAGKPWWMPMAAWRAKCLAVFVAKLA